MRHVASVSFGKDSLAMLLKLIELNYPLDEVVFYDTGMEFQAIYDTRDRMLPVLKEHGIPYVQTSDLESVMPDLDVLYMTRVQRERFFNEEDYLRLKDSYILTLDKLRNAKSDLSILHPLPRVNEISVEIDNDPRACYFKQVLYGKYMRMALILKLLKEARKL